MNTGGEPGSAWIIELDGDNQPVQKTLVRIRDEQFARDYRIDWAGPVGSDEPFMYVAGGQWRRRAGEQVRPLEAAFPEIKAARLKIVITDFRNPPLDVESAEVVAAARELVFANDAALKSPMRLYYGNPQATPPHYDLEHNLPLQLDPAPSGSRLANRTTIPTTSLLRWRSPSAGRGWYMSCWGRPAYPWRW